MPNPHPNTKGLRRGGPGRPKGSKDKATLEMQEFWREFLNSPAYRLNAQQRVIDGKAPHLEAYWVNKINGKPTEHLEHSGPDGGPIPFTWQPPQS